MHPRYFALGTALYTKVSEEGRRLAASVAWLMQQRNRDGTWGGIDGLDRFTSSEHAVMALLSAGFSPDSNIITKALTFLANVDSDQQLLFFYRSGPLLNLPPYCSIVQSDMEYIWAYKRRIGAYKDYPAPLFLFKLLRLVDPKPDLTFSEKDVLKWILNEWDDKECWYGRTSITSMALSLIYDLSFRNKQYIVSRARVFLEERFKAIGENEGQFDENIVDDCYTIYNLCERGYLRCKGQELLREQVGRVVNRILQSAEQKEYWQSPPPFGGMVSKHIYPTAVAIRALLSYFSPNRPFLMNEISTSLLDLQVVNHEELTNSFVMKEPFWGQVKNTIESNFCFVLMPFKPPKLTQIYKRYIRDTIETKTRLRCIRADDIFKPGQFMKDIWSKICEAKVIVADLTSKNANVFYELGLAHAIGIPVIIIAQSMKDVPADLMSVRVIIYSDSPDGYEKLASTLLGYLQEIE